MLLNELPADMIALRLICELEELTALLLGVAGKELLFALLMTELETLLIPERIDETVTTEELLIELLVAGCELLLEESTALLAASPVPPPHADSANNSDTNPVDHKQRIEIHMGASL